LSHGSRATAVFRYATAARLQVGADYLP
jgi:hypothetical protein